MPHQGRDAEAQGESAARPPAPSLTHATRRWPSSSRRPSAPSRPLRGRLRGKRLRPKRTTTTARCVRAPEPCRSDSLGSQTRVEVLVWSAGAKYDRYVFSVPHAASQNVRPYARPSLLIPPPLLLHSSRRPCRISSATNRGRKPPWRAHAPGASLAPLPSLPASLVSGMGVGGAL